MNKKREPGQQDNSLAGVDERDIGPDNGRRPRFATPIRKGLGKVGTGEGYSGQEYDGAGQEKWRAAQERRNLPADGEVRGSGIGAGGGDPSEDFDIATPGGAAPGGIQSANETGGEQ